MQYSVCGCWHFFADGINWYTADAFLHHIKASLSDALRLHLAPRRSIIQDSPVAHQVPATMHSDYRLPIGECCTNHSHSSWTLAVSVLPVVISAGNCMHKSRHMLPWWNKCIMSLLGYYSQIRWTCIGLKMNDHYGWHWLMPENCTYQACTLPSTRFDLYFEASTHISSGHAQSSARHCNLGAPKINLITRHTMVATPDLMCT